MYTVTDLERIRLTILHAEGWIERQSARIADRIRAGDDTAVDEMFLVQALSHVESLRRHSNDVRASIDRATREARQPTRH
jgi:hypothetical protein